MEKLVRILSQSDLRKNNWTNAAGENVVIKSVEVKMTDGTDTFVAEATDRLAEKLDENKLSNDALHGVQCKMQVRTWKSADGEERQATTIRLLNITQV